MNEELAETSFVCVLSFSRKRTQQKEGGKVLVCLSVRRWAKRERK